MTYDFTTILDRHGRDALAVDNIPYENTEIRKEFDIIPMWVADMNFPVFPEIQKRITDRVNHPSFGYFTPSEEYYNSILRWQQRHNHADMLTREAVGYENGVLGCLASAIQAFTAPGDAVLLHSPAYTGFTRALEGNGRKIVLSELVQDKNGVWRMNYKDMDRKLKENHVHFAVFCSPHNPTGRVWEREEIEAAMEVYKMNDCIVMSDEIWSDLVLNGYHHIPAQSVSEDAKNRTIAVYAPSKTFNLAGLVGAYHIIYNEYLRDRVEKQSELCHYNSMNVLSMHALIGAYSEEGDIWVDELREVLSGNAEFAYQYITEHFDGVKLAKPQGTYMLYLNCEGWCRKRDISLDELINAGVRVGVIWQDGRPFHHPWTIRMNLALPRARVEEAFERLAKYVFL